MHNLLYIFNREFFSFLKISKPKIITDNNKRKISLKIRNSSGAGEFILGRRSKAERSVRIFLSSWKNNLRI